LVSGPVSADACSTPSATHPLNVAAGTVMDRLWVTHAAPVMPGTAVPSTVTRTNSDPSSVSATASAVITTSETAGGK